VSERSATTSSNKSAVIFLNQASWLPPHVHACWTEVTADTVV